MGTTLHWFWWYPTKNTNTKSTHSSYIVKKEIQNQNQVAHPNGHFKNDMRYIKTGEIGGECNEDKKHCCFHWELNHELSSGLKQRKYVYETIK